MHSSTFNNLLLHHCNNTVKPWHWNLHRDNMLNVFAGSAGRRTFCPIQYLLVQQIHYLISQIVSQRQTPICVYVYICMTPMRWVGKRLACRFCVCPLAVRVFLRISLRGRSHLGAILKQKPSKRGSRRLGPSLNDKWKVSRTGVCVCVWERACGHVADAVLCSAAAKQSTGSAPQGWHHQSGMVSASSVSRSAASRLLICPVGLSTSVAPPQLLIAACCQKCLLHVMKWWCLCSSPHTFRAARVTAIFSDHNLFPHMCNQHHLPSWKTSKSTNIQWWKNYFWLNDVPQILVEAM